MKLFLASSLDKTFDLLAQRLPATISKRVAFIANAADPFDDKQWVDADRQAFIKAGFEVREVDVRGMTADQLSKQLLGIGVIHVCGGSVFHVLGLLKQNGLADVIVRAVREQGIVYTGTSAGSIIASSSTQIYEYDPEEDRFVKGAKDFAGLGFVPFILVPHCNSSDFVEANKIVAEHAPEFPVPLLFLHDNHAIWVQDDSVEFVIV
jgi:dipeptidase E